MKPLILGLTLAFVPTVFAEVAVPNVWRSSMSCHSESTTEGVTKNVRIDILYTFDANESGPPTLAIVTEMTSCLPTVGCDPTPYTRAFAVDRSSDTRSAPARSVYEGSDFHLDYKLGDEMNFPANISVEGESFIATCTLQGVG